MNIIIAGLTPAEKRKLRIWILREDEAGMRTRLTSVLHLSKGRSAHETSNAPAAAPSAVYRVAERFGRWGGEGLADRREVNGPVAVAEWFLLQLRQAVTARPADSGFAWADAGLTDKTRIRRQESQHDQGDQISRSLFAHLAPFRPAPGNRGPGAVARRRRGAARSGFQII